MNIIIPDNATMPELRKLLTDISNRIGGLTPLLAQYRTEAANTKNAHKRSLALAKVNAMNKQGLSKNHQTLINAYAGSDPDVIAAELAYQTAAATLEIGQAELAALDEQCKSVKKLIGSLETEIRAFNG
jgi:hypothetical protein